MLGPDSLVLILLLVAVSVAFVFAAIRLRLLPVRILCGALSIVVAMTGGIATVNYYYGYYTTWGQMWADLHGTTGNLGVISVASATPVGTGHLSWIVLPGRLSGYNRRALVYLPPQYTERQYAQVRFPVVELFHGSPGSPLTWETDLNIGQVMDSLLAKHLIGPMIVVMPSIDGPGNDYQDCVNGPGVKDETYVTTDVRTDVLARYRVSHDPFEWGLAGYSSGGYCAANIALQHRDSYGAAAIIEGYFRATDGPAAAALRYNRTLEAANSPLYLAEKLTPGSGAVPAFWIAGGTRTSDYAPTPVFAAALDRFQQVPFIKLNARDSLRAWSAALPAAMTWLWQQLAPPDLRVLFHVRTQNQNLVTTLPVLAVKTHHHVAHQSEKILSSRRGQLVRKP